MALTGFLRINIFLHFRVNTSSLNASHPKIADTNTVSSERSSGSDEHLVVKSLPPAPNSAPNNVSDVSVIGHILTLANLLLSSDHQTPHLGPWDLKSWNARAFLRIERAKNLCLH